jgi:hypothetical protein
MVIVLDAAPPVRFEKTVSNAALGNRQLVKSTVALKFVTVHEVRERQLLNVAVSVVTALKLHGPNFLKVWQFIKAAPAVVHNGRLQRDISTSCTALQFSNMLMIVVTFAVFQLRTFILVKERHAEKR